MHRRTSEGEPHGEAPATEPDRARRTDPSPPPDSPDDIFAGFVRHANAEWIASVEALLAAPDPETDADAARDPSFPPAPDTDGTDRIVLLTLKKSSPPPAAPRDEVTVRRRADEILAGERPRRGARAPLGSITATRIAETSIAETNEAPWTSVVPEQSETHQRREAAKLVPDVASVPPPAIPPQEGSEDGLMPSGELDRKLSDMDVLLQYGHAAQVESELEALRLVYPHDLLLVRRIAELYLKSSMRAPALEALFTLATGLFERRNVEGMRQALEQVKVLDPENGRARRLLALLEQRPASSPKR